VSLIGVGFNFKPGLYSVEVYVSHDDSLVFSQKIKVIKRERGKREKITIKKRFDPKKARKDREENWCATSESASMFWFTKFDYPIKNIPRVVTSGYGAWRPGSGFHKGIDYRVWQKGCDRFINIHAAARGFVRVNRHQELNGKTVIIDHGGHVFSYYLHLSELEHEGSVGQSVSCGEKIGVGGSTGRATGPHLHFAVKIPGLSLNKNGAIRRALVWTDPEEFIEFFKKFNSL
jgi:murein DD-endopeptidase MepM/ murein hydrolase activator NlpD